MPDGCLRLRANLLSFYAVQLGHDEKAAGKSVDLRAVMGCPISARQKIANAVHIVVTFKLPLWSE
jgi:hypothetical protein